MLLLLEVEATTLYSGLQRGGLLQETHQCRAPAPTGGGCHAKRSSSRLSRLPTAAALPLQVEAAALQRILDALDQNKPARAVELNDDEAAAVKSLYLLTMKPLIYAANVAEDMLADLGATDKHVQVRVLWSAQQVMPQHAMRCLMRWLTWGLLTSMSDADGLAQPLSSNLTPVQISETASLLPFLINPSCRAAACRKRPLLLVGADHSLSLSTVVLVPTSGGDDCYAPAVCCVAIGAPIAAGGCSVCSQVAPCAGGGAIHRSGDTPCVWRPGGTTQAHGQCHKLQGRQ